MKDTILNLFWFNSCKLQWSMVFFVLTNLSQKNNCRRQTVIKNSIKSPKFLTIAVVNKIFKLLTKEFGLQENSSFNKLALFDGSLPRLPEPEPSPLFVHNGTRRKQLSYIQNIRMSYRGTVDICCMKRLRDLQVMGFHFRFVHVQDVATSLMTRNFMMMVMGWCRIDGRISMN